MFIRREPLQEISRALLSAVDTTNNTELAGTLELLVDNHVLLLAVTNSEYMVSTKIDVTSEGSLQATVDANLFLKLILKMTKEAIDITVDGNSLKISGDGTYSLPMLFDGDKLRSLPRINLKNRQVEFDVNTSILKSILQFNSKELSKGAAVSPVQYMYYVDEKGCITFTTSACVNEFELPAPMKLLLPAKLVRLFRLFTDDTVNLKYGVDTLDDGMEQRKIMLSDSSIIIQSYLPVSDDLIDSVPAEAIRGRAYGDYPYDVKMNKQALNGALDRMLLFASPTVSSVSRCCFTNEGMTIYSPDGGNRELIPFITSHDEFTEPYETALDLTDLAATVQGCPESVVKISFGDTTAFVFTSGAIRTVIPECQLEN